MAGTKDQCTLQEASAAERALVEAWAACAKAMSIYPDSNTRVRATLQELVEGVAAAADGREPIQIVFHQDRVRVRDGVIGLDDHPSLGWLKERLDRVALAGVRLEAGVAADTVLQFLRHLLEVTFRVERGAQPDFCWDVEAAGIEPIERRYAGALMGAPLRGGDGEGLFTTNSSRGHELVRRLQTDREVVARIQRLEAELIGASARVGADGNAAGVDLIGRIVNLLPAEVLVDDSALLARTRAILDSVIEAVHGCDGAEALPDAALSQLMFSVGRKLFFRDANTPLPQSAAAAGDDRQGHVGDDAIEEDLDTLVWEVAALPRITDPKELLSELEFQDEQLLVYLFYLVRSDEVRIHQALYPRVRELLQRPSDESLSVLRAFLAATPELGGQAALQPLLACLREIQCMALVRRLEIVTPERAIVAFPTGFTLLLDSIDADRESDRQVLIDVARRLGPDRILAATDAIASEGGLDVHGRDAKILACNHVAMVPFVHLLLSEVKQRRLPEAVQLLRRVLNTEKEAEPLRMLPETALPIDYVLCLSARASDGTYPARTRRLVSLLLTEFLNRTDRTAAELERRMSAVTLLRDFPSSEARAVLDKLARCKGVLGFGGESPMLRRAAASALSSEHYGKA